MEAKSSHDFVSSAPDELSFTKGSILKIINIDDDPNWYKAEQDGRQGFIPANYVQLFPHEWFHGRISRAQAEAALMSCPYEGAFLFRESETSPGGFSLSLRVHNRSGIYIQHFKVLRDDIGKYFLWVMKFSSLNELIEYHRVNTASRTEDIFLKWICTKTGEAIQLQPTASANPPPRAAAAPASKKPAARPPVSAPAPAVAVSRPAAPVPAPVPAKPKSVQKTVTAAYNFDPQESGELRLRKGDVIVLLDASDANWWKGTLKGDTGLFPASYVTKNA